MVSSSAIWASSVASERPPGRRPSPIEKADVVLAHDVADVVEQLVHRILLAVDQHPLGEQRAAPRDDADQPLAHILQVLAQHPGVDGEVVDALFRLVLETSRMMSWLRSSSLRPMIIE